MQGGINPRELIVEILTRVLQEGEHSHAAIRRVLGRHQFLLKRDRAFITRAFAGTLERMIELDYIINQFSRVKVNKMKPMMQNIIRSAVYQIKYMDGVPNSAVCNEAVKIAKKRGFYPLRGFVNGLLRNICVNLENVKWPDASDEERFLSVRYSMPEWIVRQWLPVYGRETTEETLRNFLRESPTSIRCNLQKNSRAKLEERLRREGVRVSENPRLPYALWISGYDYLEALESFREGAFQVQDASSMLAAEWAKPKEGDYVLDVCAAPGGKALHFADCLKGSGHVKARDISGRKVEMLRENIRRSGFLNIEAEKGDALKREEALVGRADIVLADLPCSGLGVLGKKADIKYKMTREKEEALAALQREILGVVKAYVKPGGILLYTTCTIDREENEKNSRRFVREHSDFRLERERQLLPGEDGSDGFYLARFRKGEEGHG